VNDQAIEGWWRVICHDGGEVPVEIVRGGGSVEYGWRARVLGEFAVHWRRSASEALWFAVEGIAGGPRGPVVAVLRKGERTQAEILVLVAKMAGMVDGMAAAAEAEPGGKLSAGLHAASAGALRSVASALRPPDPVISPKGPTS